MRFWLNLLGYQAAWFIAVGFAARGLAWPGMLACLGFAAISWWMSPLRRSDLQLMVAALACGLLLDGVLAATGWLRYAAPSPALPGPAWIATLWVAFAMTLQHSLQWVIARPAIAIVFGVIGGPLAYWGASRGFDAVVFTMPLQATLTLAIGWSIAMGVLTAISRRHTAIAHQSGASA
ncbi:DUF2878 domain-containing protein [Thermomonas sp.]|uniref:DUF2878 domain-containing protein n=1 Tax=Thermomonas sp. TaxID=1971895 RepID=UPI0035B1D214